MVTVTGTNLPGHVLGEYHHVTDGVSYLADKKQQQVNERTGSLGADSEFSRREADLLECLKTDIYSCRCSCLHLGYTWVYPKRS